MRLTSLLAGSGADSLAAASVWKRLCIGVLVLTRVGVVYGWSLCPAEPWPGVLPHQRSGRPGRGEVAPA